MATGKTALVTGITGQDGSLLAEFLLKKSYRVIGLQEWSATDNTCNLDGLKDNPDFILRYGDMSDGASLLRLVQEFQPDEIYNLAGMSHVGVSFDLPEMTADINGVGTTRILEAIRSAGLAQRTRFYQASSSEMFGNALAPQNEQTPFQPCSPYGAAKLYAYWMTVNYRQTYGMHASNGILFNHESTVRGEHFVTRKIAQAAAKIACGRQRKLSLGNLDARRDWGDARDYVRGMWMMLQQDKPGDYVLATGESHSVRDFTAAAFKIAGIDIIWRGSGKKEQGIHARDGRVLIDVDPAFYRPAELHELCGDASQAREKLGWKPAKSFDALVRDMVTAEIKFEMTGEKTWQMAS